MPYFCIGSGHHLRNVLDPLHNQEYYFVKIVSKLVDKFDEGFLRYNIK